MVELEITDEFLEKVAKEMSGKSVKYTAEQIRNLIEMPWPTTRVHIERLRSRPYTEEERIEAEKYLKIFS